MGETRTRVSRTRRDPVHTTASTGADAPNRWYFLFAGSEQAPRGGLGDLVRTFDSEQPARSAFREMRLRGTSAACWAQLAVVDAANGIQPLCWFGIGATPNQNLTLSTRQNDVPSRRMTRTSRLRPGRLQPRG